MSTLAEHLSPVVVESDDVSKYKFKQYAQANYQEGSPFSHRRGFLQRPLHFQDNDHNNEVALTINHVIQRFMFDLPEPTDTVPNEEDNVFLRTLARNSDFGEGSLKRKIDSVKMPGWTSIPPLSSMSKPTTNMEKVRFICSYGIYCQEMRDEIYNQICVQLTNNPSKMSLSRGWVILAVCLGCFPPSEKFINYLRNFIRQGPNGYDDYCENKLNRTMAIGCRKLVPNSLELHAAKIEGKIMVPITTMDSKTYEFEVDSSTTCEELLKELQSKLGLKSVFGFSVYAKQSEEVFNWGCGSDCIMDLLSLCEQYAIYKHIPEEDRHNWSIFVRKDVFLSSHNAASDPIETNLIYWQIMGGIHVGEYCCTDDDELAELLAKRYYIEYGKILTEENLGNLVENGGPPDQDYQQHLELTQLIKTKFQSTASIVNLSRPNMFKLDVVNLACSKKDWLKDFSRIFNANLVSGPKIPKGEVRLFFHSGGVDLLSTVKKSKGAFFLNIPFEHIASITNDSPEYMKIKGGRFDTSNHLTIRTYEKSTYTFASPRAKDMYTLGYTLLEDYKGGDPSDIFTSP